MPVAEAVQQPRLTDPAFRRLSHMLPTEHLVAFALTTLVLVLIPGPSVLFTVGRALSVGRRAALLTVVGNSAGLYVQVIAVALGLGALVALSLIHI